MGITRTTNSLGHKNFEKVKSSVDPVANDGIDPSGESIMCMEQMIECEFRKIVGPSQPIKVFEDGGEVIVMVGDRIYINVEELKFCFVSHRDIVQFSH